MRLIDVDALKESFGERRLDGDWCICGDETTARNLIDEAPIIDAEPVRHGKWGKSNAISGLLSCKNCGCQRNPNFKIGFGAWNYCPNCGAKMDLKD